MEKRKNPEKELSKRSGLFFHIGLFTAMLLCVSAFEYRTPQMTSVVPGDIDKLYDSPLDSYLPPVKSLKKSSPPKPKPPIIPRYIPAEDPEPVSPEPPEIDPDPVPEPIPLPPSEDESPAEHPDEPFNIVESMPEPKGGYDAFYRYIAKKLKYPAKAKRMAIQGKVYVQFIVDTDGSLSDIEVIKGIGGGCDEEVVRIMQQAPAWKPGKQRGVPVRVRQVLPIQFRLD